MIMYPLIILRIVCVNAIIVKFVLYEYVKKSILTIFIHVIIFLFFFC